MLDISTIIDPQYTQNVETVTKAVEMINRAIELFSKIGADISPYINAEGIRTDAIAALAQAQNEPAPEPEPEP